MYAGALPVLHRSGLTSSCGWIGASGLVQRAFSSGSTVKSTSSPQESVSKLKGGRYGSRLLRTGQVDAFNRMRSILGAGGSAVGGEAGNKDKRKDVVHISVLQTMKFLQMPSNYKQALAAYRVSALGKEMGILLEKTEAFLSSPSAKGPGR